MVSVRFLISVAERLSVFHSGRVYTLPTADAEYYISKGYAEKVREEKSEPVQRPLTVQQVKTTMKRPVKR